jgi:cobalamin biosynthetic protein CobC
LVDMAWREKTRGSLAEAAARLDGLFAKSGLEVIGGTSLFRLVRWILVRRFAEYPGWLRFGLPGREADWQRLAAALAARS